LRDKYVKASGQLLEEGILTHPSIFGFYTKQQLKELARKAYLNIHCATVEVEGLSCLEAIREGVVPLIATGHLAATSQFALDERSLFPEQDAKALAEKIDWWIEHPEERMRMGQEYADSARKYNIEDSISRIIDMYNKALTS
jgi:glycosyltransferase involved in cell wall biosynthesis